MSAAVCLLSLIFATTGQARPSLPDLPADVFAPLRAEDTWPSSVFAEDPDDDVIDVLVLGKSRATVVRFRATIEGRPFRAVWFESLMRLHAYLDVDGNGLLTSTEAGRAPWTSILTGGAFANNGGLQKPGRYDANGDGKVTFAEFETYVQNSWSYKPVSLQNGPAPDGRTDAVFRLLDRDNDQAISAKEFASTDACVAVLDRDENELIDQGELNPDQSTQMFFFGNQNTANNTPVESVYPLTTAEERAAAALRLLAALGKGRDKAKPEKNRVTAEAIGADPASFRAADADGDGSLDLNELKTRYLRHPSPGVEVRLDLGAAATGAKLKRSTPSQKSPLSDVKTTASDNVVAAMDETEIEIQGSDVFQDNAAFYLQQFKAADADKNGVIDAKEMRGNPFVQQFYLVADRDRNFKLTEAELNAYAERVRDAGASRLGLTVTDRGPDLFPRLDANNDSQISVRELRAAWERFKTMDRDKNGQVTNAELPNKYQLLLGRGANAANVQVVMPTMTATAPSNPTPGAVIPTWFTGMDRNGDGDVSPNEFLGPADAFRRYDRDKDGLIDKTEAVKAIDPQ